MQPAVLLTTTIFSDLGRDGLKVAGGLVLLVLAPTLLLIVAAGALVATLFSIPLPVPAPAGTLTASGVPVPADQLAVMQAVARDSGVPWEVLAAIASVESDFGRNMATSSAGAIGYGQFLPSSWAAYGNGGDPYDYRDAIPAMARYLTDNGALTDLAAAVYAYNHSWDYVATVLDRASYYTSQSTASTAPDPVTSEATP